MVARRSGTAGRSHSRVSELRVPCRATWVDTQRLLRGCGDGSVSALVRSAQMRRAFDVMAVALVAPSGLFQQVVCIDGFSAAFDVPFTGAGRVTGCGASKCVFAQVASSHRA